MSPCLLALVWFKGPLNGDCLRLVTTGLPQSGKISGKLVFFPGQGKVREFCGWSGKFRKDLECQ